MVAAAAVTEIASQSSLGGRRTAYLAIANFVFLVIVLAIVLFSSHGQSTKDATHAPAVSSLHQMNFSLNRALVAEEII